MAEDNKIIAELVLEGAETFQANLKKASDTSVVEKEFKDMGNAIDLAKKKLATLTPGTSAFKKLENEIKASEIATKSFAGGMDSLKKQLRDATANMQIMNNQLAEMKKQGLQGTSAFKALENGLKQAKQQVGDLKDEIGDLNAETSSLGSDTRGLDTMIRTLNIGASVFGAVQGAQALFGIESEDLQKKLVQLNAIMAISNGLQQIQEELTRRDSIAKKAAAVATSIYTAVVGTSTGAMKLFKIALASTGIGLLIAGVGILVANFQKIKNVY
jgi:predicted  nucleic acid-binding Zn-ribbon protein